MDFNLQARRQQDTHGHLAGGFLAFGFARNGDDKCRI